VTKIRSVLARACIALGAILVSATASAVPVTLNLQGSVTGYQFIDLSASFPLGASVNLSLTFNETFSDGTYSFADNLGPVSGLMSIGSASYSFNNALANSYSYDISSGEAIWVAPRFVGSGTSIGQDEFYGMTMQITPTFTLLNDILLGFGFTNGSSTSYGYARITPSQYSFTTAVPEPPTVVLMTLGLVALGFLAIRHRRTLSIQIR
jgi:hypothetical protein